MDQKYERLSINLLHRDKVALRQLANITGEAMSTVVRRLIRDQARRYGLLSPIALGTSASSEAAEVDRE